MGIDRLTTSLLAEAKKQADEIDDLQSKLEEATPIEKEEPTPPSPTAYKYQTLINELQKLTDSKVFLKEKSQGPSVGTVQRFLNIYNDTSAKVDNDYGASTKVAVIDFQKDTGITADGEAGPGTFKKMIEWLKKQ